MKPLPTVVAADYCGGYKIRLVFSDGVDAIVDFEPWLDGPVFEPVRNPSYFARFFIEAGTIVWPNGADIAPETLHARAKADAAA